MGTKLDDGLMEAKKLIISTEWLFIHSPHHALQPKGSVVTYIPGPPSFGSALACHCTVYVPAVYYCPGCLFALVRVHA